MLIDIATKIMTPDDSVYIVRPGDRYWAFERMKSSSRIFLDFPDLQIGNEEKFPDKKQMRAIITRSLAIREWHDGGRVGPRPSGNATEFQAASYGRRLGRYAGAIKRLFSDLTIGSTIVVPDQGYYGEVLIGEIASQPVIHSWQNVYGGEPMITRRVRWVRSKTRGRFSEQIRDLLGHTTPVLQVPNSLKLEIISSGYDQFSFDGEFSARINTNSAQFSTLDDYFVQSFLNYITGILIASEQGADGTISYDTAIDLVRSNPLRAMELQQNINSPGFQRLYDSSVAPLAAVALMTAALATAGCSPASTASEPIEIVNTKSPENDCTIAVAERVANARELMLVSDWERQCTQLQQAHSSTGISTTMSVVDDG